MRQAGPFGVRLATIALIVGTSGCRDDATPESGSTPVPESKTVTSTPAVGVESRPLPDALRDVIVLLQRGRLDEARDRADAFLADHADDPQALFLSGLAHHRLRNYEVAEPRMTRSLELDPANVVAHHFLGYCRFYQGDLAGARVAFETHLRSMPDESDSHFGVGLVDLEEGRFEAAEERFLYAIGLITALETENPDLYRVRHRDLAKCHARLADIAFARADYAEARRLLYRAIEIDPNQYAAYFVLAQVERRLGNEEEADRMHALYEQMAARRGRGRGETP